jgi:hypothetical protein
MNLTQSGANIGGTYSDRDGAGTVSGAVTAGNTVRLTVTQGSFNPFTFNGTANAGVTSITGTVANTGLPTAPTFTMGR